MTPHICEELWTILGETEPLTSVAWPQVDESARERSRVQIVVQVNGKVRARIEMAAGSTEAEVRERALAEGNVQRHIGEKSIRKLILVPDRLLNIVVG